MVRMSGFVLMILACCLVISLDGQITRGFFREVSDLRQPPRRNFSPRNPHQPQHEPEQGSHLLPADAQIVPFDPDGDGKPEGVVLRAHLKNPAQEQLVIIYRKSVVEASQSSQSMSSLMLVIFDRRGGQWYKEWETELAGPQLWMQDGKHIGFQIMDVNGDGKDEIVTITGTGASLGAYLQIFAWGGRSYQQVNPLVDGHFFEFDRDERGHVRVRVRSRYEALFHVYEWDGNRYREVDAESYHRREAEFYENVLLGSEPVTPQLFGEYLQRAVWNYRKDGQIQKAIALCEHAVQVLDLPGKFVAVMPSEAANFTKEQIKAIEEDFERKKGLLPALPHRLLGELYEQEGNMTEALRHYERAVQFGSSDQTLHERIKAIKQRLRFPSH